MMTDHPTRRGWLLRTTLVLAGSGCALWEPPSRLVLSAADLEAAVARRFPVDRRLLDVLDVTVASPRLQLLPDRNRVATRWQVSTRDRVYRSQWRGSLALDSALRYDAGDHSIRLHEVRVSEFRMEDDQGAAALGSRGERVAALLAEHLLEGLSVYQVPAERLARLQRAGVQPAGVTITAHGVEVAFEPISR